MADTIRCPQCGAEVEIGEALAARVREQVRGEVLAQVQGREKAAAAREALLTQREEQSAAREATAERRIQAQVAERLKAERVQADQEARASVALELKAAQDRLAEASADLQKAKRAELELRQREEAVERARSDLDLTVARRLAEERLRIQTDARKAADEQSALHLAQKDAQIAGMTRTIDELKRKAEQGSQQLQGEVLEASLEEALRRTFPTDLIEPVAKGVRGADVVQRVRTAAGQECGIILWESKRTKAWQADWLPKLRDDQRAQKADVSALVTQTLPRDAQALSVIDGVWVTGFSTWLGLAHALRKGLVDVAEAHRAQQGKGEKLEQVYAYLTGPQFQNRVHGFLEPLRAMQKDLEAERAAMERLWAKRQKQIERAVVSLAGLRGDVEGMAGGALLGMPSLELPGGEGEPAP